MDVSSPASATTMVHSRVGILDRLEGRREVMITCCVATQVSQHMPSLLVALATRALSRQTTLRDLVLPTFAPTSTVTCCSALQYTDHQA